MSDKEDLEKRITTFLKENGIYRSHLLFTLENDLEFRVLSDLTLDQRIIALYEDLGFCLDAIGERAPINEAHVLMNKYNGLLKLLERHISKNISKNVDVCPKCLAKEKHFH